MQGTKIYYISGLKKPGIGATITADSTPVLDGWGWGDYWGCADWMQWHKLVKAKYGKDEANARFIDWWGKQDSTASPYNWCKYNSEFANYFAAQGIDVGWMLSHIVTGASNISDAVVDTAGNISTGVSNASSGVSSLGTMLGFLLPVAAIGAAYYGYKTYIKAK